MDQAVLTPPRKKPSVAHGAAPPARVRSRTTAGPGEIAFEAGVGVSPARARRMLAAMKALAAGDFVARLPSDWSGTEGQIADAFNAAIQSAARITDEAARLRTSVGKEGRLSQRMSAPGAMGSWAAQVESWNTLMDDLVRPTHDIARTIGAVAKGDLGQSMDLEVDSRAAAR